MFSKQKLPCCAISFLGKKASLGIALFQVQARLQRKLTQSSGKAFPESVGFCLPLAQNNPFAKIEYFRVTNSTSCQEVG